MVRSVVQFVARLTRESDDKFSQHDSLQLRAGGAGKTRQSIRWNLSRLPQFQIAQGGIKNPSKTSANGRDGQRAEVPALHNPVRRGHADWIQHVVNNMQQHVIRHVQQLELALKPRRLA
jgi:hypothetical protein